jgi:hypothetical protein
MLCQYKFQRKRTYFIHLLCVGSGAHLSFIIITGLNRNKYGSSNPFSSRRDLLLKKLLGMAASIIKICWAIDYE